jgi:hypothetical protein
MTNLRRGPGKKGVPPGKSGLMGNPYNTKLHNTYRFGGEPEDIKQYWDKLTITGTNMDEFEAVVYHRYNGQDVEVGSESSQQLELHDELEVQGPSMRMPLTVRRAKGCKYEFEYASGDDGIVFFPFSTEDEGSEGYGDFAEPKGQQQVEDWVAYCKDTTAKKVRTITCSFPAW